MAETQSESLMINGLKRFLFDKEKCIIVEMLGAVYLTFIEGVLSVIAL